MNICQTNLYPGRSFLLPSSYHLLFFPFNRRKSMTHLSSCSPLGQRQIWAHELTVIVGHLSGDFIFFLIIKLNKVGCLLLCVRAQSIPHVDPAEGSAGPQQSADTHGAYSGCPGLSRRKLFSYSKKHSYCALHSTF